ncbi:MAG: molybdate ABC transporter permease subunit, partial [Actinomycetes bacterium]
MLALVYLLLPLVGLLVRAPWADAATVLTSASARAALRLSLVTATAATGVVLLLGVPLAWLLA